MEHVATYLGINPIVVKRSNLYKIGQHDLGGDPLQYCQLTSLYDRMWRFCDETIVGNFSFTLPKRLGRTCRRSLKSIDKSMQVQYVRVFCVVCV